ncbi:hypothetical protein GCM10010329_05140 [Streptomyces spiroverticillatus]|uniref:Uncharacterized protein n=1 Tax=Streptomyces finlayi TaxID=67296 RepID=A0A918WTC3_9ACTN|nr:hypothetical protein [Streptomyces finlayi]GGZ88032.1 hypothetical protein GCM10010329_05140 [Streptomyces spiroverticillatus]GHC79130.1 hypothetical protein GCM10010334_05120 [Streptomyces finlayi]
MADSNHEDASVSGPRFGTVNNSAMSFGANSRADTSNYFGGAAPSPEHQKLLTEVQALRDDLARLAATREIEVLDAELVTAEAELATTGQAPRPLLDRVRHALTAAGPIAASFASAVALGESLTALLPGS